jgi:cytochrome c
MRTTSATILAIIWMVWQGAVGQAASLSPSAQRGLNFAKAHCSRCHSIDKVTPSPLRIAPPFRTLHNRYPVESLEEALGEGIVTGHQNMPQFRLEPDQIGDFIAFLKSLE